MHTQRELRIASSMKTESILSEEFGSKDAPEQKTAAHAAQVSHTFICKNRKKNLEKKKNRTAPLQYPEYSQTLMQQDYSIMFAKPHKSNKKGKPYPKCLHADGLSLSQLSIITDHWHFSKV